MRDFFLLLCLGGIWTAGIVIAKAADRIARALEAIEGKMK